MLYTPSIVLVVDVDVLDVCPSRQLHQFWGISEGCVNGNSERVWLNIAAIVCFVSLMLVGVADILAAGAN